MHIDFTIPGKPQPKQRPRVTKRGITYTPKETKDYEIFVQRCYQDQIGRKVVEGPLKIILVFWLPKPKKPKYPMPAVKPDLDNLMKSITDALNGVAYDDDSQIVEARILKLYTPTEGYVSVTIEEVR